MGNIACCLSGNGSLTQTSSAKTNFQGDADGEEDVSRVLVEGKAADAALVEGSLDESLVAHVQSQGCKRTPGSPSRFHAVEMPFNRIPGALNGERISKAAVHRPMESAGISSCEANDASAECGSDSQLESSFLGSENHVETLDLQIREALARSLVSHPVFAEFSDASSDCGAARDGFSPRRLEPNPSPRALLPARPRGILKPSRYPGGEVRRVGITIRGVLGFFTSRRYSAIHRLQSDGCVGLQEVKPKENNKKVTFKLPPEIITWSRELWEEAAGRSSLEEEDSAEETAEESTVEKRAPFAGHTPRTLCIPMRAEGGIPADSESATGDAVALKQSQDYPNKQSHPLVESVAEATERPKRLVAQSGESPASTRSITTIKESVGNRDVPSVPQDTKGVGGTSFPQSKVVHCISLSGHLP